MNREPGRSDKAEEYYRKAIALREDLLKTNASVKRSLAYSYRYLAETLEKLERNEEAPEYYRKAEDLDPTVK